MRLRASFNGLICKLLPSFRWAKVVLFHANGQSSQHLDSSKNKEDFWRKMSNAKLLDWTVWRERIHSAKPKNVYRTELYIQVMHLSKLAVFILNCREFCIYCYDSGAPHPWLVLLWQTHAHFFYIPLLYASPYWLEFACQLFWLWHEGKQVLVFNLFHNGLLTKVARCRSYGTSTTWLYFLALLLNRRVKIDKILKRQCKQRQWVVLEHIHHPSKKSNLFSRNILLESVYSRSLCLKMIE